MPKKNIIIPVGFDYQDLERGAASAQKIFASASKAVSSETRKNAKEIIDLYQAASKEYAEAMISGGTSNKKNQILAKTFTELEKRMHSLGKTVNAELSAINFDMFSEQDKENIKATNDEIEQTTKKLTKLSNIKLRSLDEVVDSKIQQNLKIDSYTSITAALNALNKQEDRLVTLRAKQAKEGSKLTAAEKNRLAYLEETDKQRKTAIKALEKENATYSKNATAIDETTKKLDELNKLKAKQEASAQKKAGKNLQTEADILAGYKPSDLNSFQAQMQKLTQNTSIFSSITNGAKESVLGFVTSLVTGKLIIDGIKMIFRETIKTITELDAAFNEIAMVTTYTTKEVWKMKDAFVGIAQTTGSTVAQVTELAAAFFRQGRSYSEVLQLTEAAGVAAKIAGISAGDSVNYLTAAINGYQLSANQAMAVSDKFAALAASSATDYEELATALSKVAAQAYSAGVNMDNMMGFIAKAIETTREAPENIGTAFKTIFARMQELKDLGATVEDGMDIGRVDKALKQIGVQLTDQTGEIRNLDEVLIEVGKKWNTLNKNQKAYIATALAGTRQQTRLLAVFEDFDRTMELAEISANSLGASLAQQAKYQNSIAYSINQMQVAWQDFVSSLVSSDAFLLFYKTIAGVLNGLNSIIDILGSAKAPLLVLGVGLLLLTQSLTKAAMSGAAYNLSQKKIVFESFKQILANTGLGMSFTTLTTFINGATGSLEVFKAALLQSGLGIFILAAGAAAAVLIYMATAEERAKKKTEELMESIKKTQADVFNFRKKADDLETLVSKYEDINKSVTKTNADLEEQQSLIKQIQDIIGDEFIVTGIGGELNTSLINAKIQELKDQADIDFQDTVDKAISSAGSISKAYNQAINLNDASAQQFLIIAKAMEHLSETTDGATVSYSEFLDQSKEIIDLETKRANIGLNSVSRVEKYRITSTAVGNNGERLIDNVYNTKEEAQKLLDYYGDAVRLSIEYEIDEKSAQQTQIEAETFFDGIRAKSFFTEEDAENQARILSGFFELSPEAQAALVKSDATISNIISAVELLNLSTEAGGNGLQEFANIVSGSNFNMDQIGNFAATIENLNFNETIDSAKILTDVIKYGPQVALDNFANSGTANLIDIINTSQALIDTLSDVTFEDLALSAKSLNSTFDAMSKVNDMLTGAVDYDIAFMNEMLDAYPQLNAMIADGNALTEEQITTLAAEKRKAFEEELDRKEAEIELTIANNNMELTLLEEMLQAGQASDELANEIKLDTNEDGILTLEELYGNYFAKRSEMDVKFDKEAAKEKIKTAMLTADSEEKIFLQGRLDALNASKDVEFNLNDLYNITGVDPNQQDWEKVIEDRMRTLVSNNTQLEQQLTNISNIRKRLTASGSLAGNTENTEAAKEYLATLNEIAILTEQLAALSSIMNKYTFMEEHAKTGQEYVIALSSQNSLLEDQNSIINDLIKAQEKERDATYDNLGALKDHVKIINGRLVPVMGEYINLNGESQEAIDNAVESYNELNTGIEENSIALEENTIAIEENLQKIEDKTVELYDIIAEAVTNSEKDKLDALIKGLDAERKILDERRKLYEDAFAEEDFTANLAETNAARAEVINQLAALEGATDLASVQQREDLLSQKADLDKDYNETLLDYNRDALLERLDQEEQYLDDLQTEYEDTYEQLVNDRQWMEDEVQRIIEEGKDYTIQFLRDHSTDYIDAWSFTKDNIEDEWINLYEVVTSKLDDIASSIPDFSDMLAQLKAAADYVAKINTGGSNNLRTGGSNNLRDGGTITNPVKQYYFNGTPYGSDSAAEKKANDARDAYIKTFRDAYNEALKKSTNRKSRPDERAYWAQVADERNAAFANASLKKVEYYKTGGLNTTTGLAMLHGTPTKPERVLSPVQTELFDSLVSSLEKLSLGSTTTSESLSIGNITIQTNQLNDNLDFAAAGQTLATEISKAISQRGLTINKRK